jgi:hypothetical protein
MYHNVQYGQVGIEGYTLYLYSSILYTILHSISTLPYCTLSYILSLLFHTARSRDRIKDSVQYGGVVIECKIMYSKEE